MAGGGATIPLAGQNRRRRRARLAEERRQQCLYGKRPIRGPPGRRCRLFRRRKHDIGRPFEYLGAQFLPLRGCDLAEIVWPGEMGAGKCGEAHGRRRLRHRRAVGSGTRCVVFKIGALGDCRGRKPIRQLDYAYCDVVSIGRSEGGGYILVGTLSNGDEWGSSDRSNRFRLQSRRGRDSRMGEILRRRGSAGRLSDSRRRRRRRGKGGGGQFRQIFGFETPGGRRDRVAEGLRRLL